MNLVTDFPPLASASGSGKSLHGSSSLKNRVASPGVAIEPTRTSVNLIDLLESVTALDAKSKVQDVDTGDPVSPPVLPHPSWKDKVVSPSVKYAWQPVLCPKCQVFGHGDCSNSEPTGPKQVNKIWVAKAGKGPILADEPLGVAEGTNASSIQQLDTPIGVTEVANASSIQQFDGSGSSSNVVPGGSAAVLAHDGVAPELSAANAVHSGTGGFDNSSPSLVNPDLDNHISPSKIGSGNRFAILNDVATLNVHSPVPEVLQDFPQSDLGKMESRIFEVPKYVSPKAGPVLPINSIGFDPGLNKSCGKVRKWIYENRLSFVGLVETKVSLNNLDATMKLCLPSHWNFIHNIGHGVVARIVVAWDTSCFTITPVLVDAQCIACKVQQPQSPTCFYISVVYGFNWASDRRSLWSELRTLYGSIGNDAWLMLGDFSTQAERVGSGSFDGLSTLDFNACLEAIDMEDLASKGSWFTWSNRRGGIGFIKSRIDRALVNSKWQDQFPESEAVFQPPGMSDHCPIVVTILPQYRRRIPFKFFSFWMTHNKFSDVLLDAWSMVVHGNPMDVLSQKLRKLKSLLKDFNKEFYSDIHKRVALAHDELSILQTQCLALPYDVTLHESEKDALLKYTDLVAAKEDFNRQKSRVKWLALGFYAILREKIRIGQFTYHPKCSALSLAHLAFADELFLLSRADCHSIVVFQSALDDFYLFSGLKPNLQKSQIFFSGVATDLKRSLLAILPIPEGHLSVRYLGVPLISSRLRNQQKNRQNTEKPVIRSRANNTTNFKVVLAILNGRFCFTHSKTMRFERFLLFANPIISFLLPILSFQTTILEQWKWQIIAFFLFSGLFIARAISAAIISTMENSHRRIKGYLPYAYDVRKPFELFLWSGMVLTSWISFIETPQVGETNPSIKTITKTLYLAVVSTVICGTTIAVIKATVISNFRPRLEGAKGVLFFDYVLRSLLHPLDDLNQVAVERDFIVNVSPSRRGDELLWSPITFSEWRLISPDASTDWEVWNLLNFYVHGNFFEEALQQLPHNERNNPSFVAKEILRRLSKSESQRLNFEDLLHCMPRAIAEEAWKSMGNGNIRRAQLFSMMAADRNAALHRLLVRPKCASPE
ncbi:hypothetical protein Vadar_003220 [Vaccinium darrowii]|uniref:Uncharacterized protein n=1 Tax=Vaccinium darrowii TaxID=229202 RepID=A0ACB7YBP0_9ERIC|nr:hypothetical protein Vadar_003220 [Vaccinium darrowii]